MAVLFISLSFLLFSLTVQSMSPVFLFSFLYCFTNHKLHHAPRNTVSQHTTAASLRWPRLVVAALVITDNYPELPNTPVIIPSSSAYMGAIEGGDGVVLHPYVCTNYPPCRTREWGPPGWSVMAGVKVIGTGDVELLPPNQSLASAAADSSWH